MRFCSIYLSILYNKPPPREAPGAPDLLCIFSKLTPSTSQYVCLSIPQPRAKLFTSPLTDGSFLCRGSKADMLLGRGTYFSTEGPSSALPAFRILPPTPPHPHCFELHRIKARCLR